MLVKSITGSGELVKILNRFGHSISYDVLEEIETAIATPVIQYNDDNICIPSNIRKGIFSSFCWDNNDLSEETLSGGGTTHCTNGIVIQQDCDWCENSVENIVPANGRKIRSLKLSNLPELDHFNIGKKIRSK